MVAVSASSVPSVETGAVTRCFDGFPMVFRNHVAGHTTGPAADNGLHGYRAGRCRQQGSLRWRLADPFHALVVVEAILPGIAQRLAVGAAPGGEHALAGFKAERVAGLRVTAACVAVSTGVFRYRRQAQQIGAILVDDTCGRGAVTSRSVGGAGGASVARGCIGGRAIADAAPQKRERDEKWQSWMQGRCSLPYLPDHSTQFGGRVAFAP